MAEEEVDYTTLPLNDRLSHKLWKARVSAYEELSKSFSTSRNENDPSFREYGSVDQWKRIATDSNVVAQEAGLAAFVDFLTYGGKSGARMVAVVPSLCEKGLSSSRAGTKQKTLECLMMIAELGSVDPVLDEMLPSLSAKLPKLVSGTVNAITELTRGFGLTDPRRLIPLLPKLFSHADRNVRAETSTLAVELSRWMGRDALEAVLFQDLKPIQQKDLTKLIEKCDPSPPVATRVRKAAVADNDGDVNMDMDGVSVSAAAPAAAPVAVDPYDLFEAVDVLSKLPADLESRLGSAKWKDRVEVLEEVHKILDVKKMVAKADYSELVRLFAKCFKDANVQAVTLAANCVEFMALALRSAFAKYHTIVLVPLLERTKEKKQSVSDALARALYAVFMSTSLSDLLEETLTAMQNKTPQVKIECTKFLVKMLQETQVAPKNAEVDAILAVVKKIVADTQAPVRTVGFEAAGTLMKITGEREMGQFLESLDSIKQKKIRECFESATVKASGLKPAAALGSKAPAPVNKPGARPGTRTSSLPSLTNPLRKPGVGSSLPAKRVATSPLRGETQSRALPGVSRGLAGRSLTSQAPPPVPAVDETELLELRAAKDDWLMEKESLLQQIQELKQENNRLVKDLTSANTRLDKAQEQIAKESMAARANETKLMRVESDLQDAQAKIARMQGGSLGSSVPQSPSLGRNSSLRSPARHSSISEGVGGLHINSAEKVSKRHTLFSEHRLNDFEATDDSWKRAAEVTSQLKARIEKMKARSRGSQF